MIGVMPSLYSFTNEQDATSTKEVCWWVTSKLFFVYKKPRTTNSFDEWLSNMKQL
jgi:hypothetical protein